VFDIDDTLVKFILDPKKAEDADIQLNFNAAGKGTKEIKQSCNLIPGILELLQYIVLERKLRMAFFSAARSTRNGMLIPVILEKAFPDSFKEVLANSPIFSYHHIHSMGKDLSVVTEHFEKYFSREVSLENVILIDDDIFSNVEGQNFLRVPKERELGNDRIVYVAGLLDELLSSGLPLSQFLKVYPDVNSRGPLAKETAQPFTTKGLQVLQRLNPVFNR
jgi:hypothetical protein